MSIDSVEHENLVPAPPCNKPSMGNEKPRREEITSRSVQGYVLVSPPVLGIIAAAPAVATTLRNPSRLETAWLAWAVKAKSRSGENTSCAKKRKDDKRVIRNVWKNFTEFLELENVRTITSTNLPNVKPPWASKVEIYAGSLEPSWRQRSGFANFDHHNRCSSSTRSGGSQLRSKKPELKRFASKSQ